MGGRGNTGTQRNSVVYEAPVFDTKLYKSTTQEMKDVVISVYRDMQEEFPILAKSVEFDFYNGGGFDSIGNAVSIDGRALKQYLQHDNLNRDNYYTNYVSGVIAHELTHTIQQRLDGRNSEETTSRILNTAIDKFVKDNPGMTKAGILKSLKDAYGLRTLDSDPSRRPMMERMAMAVQHYYVDKKFGKRADKTLAKVGSYVAEELKREMR